MQQLSLHLAENLAELDARFGASADYYAKEIMIYHCRGCIVLFDGMASLDSLWELLLDAASRQALQQPCPCTGQEVYEHILHGSASPAESTPVEDLPDLVKRLTAGMAVLLLDGCAKGIAFSVQALKYRSVDEPEGEGNLRGSREGFADLLRVNLSLLRRLVRPMIWCWRWRRPTPPQGQSTLFATAGAKQTLPWCDRCGRPLPLQSRSCCWTAAILYRGFCPAGHGCSLRSATPSARRRLRPNYVRAAL